MKSNSLITFVMAVIFLANCGNSNADASKKHEANNSLSEKKEESMPSSSAQGDDIVGEWNQEFTSYDKNNNNKYDPEERTTVNNVGGYDWLRFDSDGTGLTKM